MQYIVVAISSWEALKFLDIVSGKVRISLDGCGEWPTAPAIDPWDGHIWNAWDSSSLTICTAAGKLAEECLFQTSSHEFLPYDNSYRLHKELRP